MWRTVISQLSAVRWHFSQLDGFLCLTSVSKGSANHSQRLPLDKDANRALTDSVPPSLWLWLNSSPSKQDLRVFRPDQTLKAAAALVNVSSSTYAYKGIHMHVDAHGPSYTNARTITIIRHSLTKQTVHHIHTCIHIVSPIIACDKT